MKKLLLLLLFVAFTTHFVSGQTFSVSDSSLNFTNSESEQWVSLSCTQSWYTQSSETWVSSSKVNDSTLYVYVTNNYGIARTANVYLVASDSSTYIISVYQQTGAVPVVFSVSDSILHVSYNLSHSYVTAFCTTPYTINTNQSWVSVQKNDSLLTITTEANTGYARSATITLSNGGLDNYYIYVFQEANPDPTVFSLSDSIINFTSVSSQNWLYVDCNKTWNAYSDQSWLSLNRSGDSILIISADKNAYGVRSAKITLAASDSTKAYINVYQASDTTQTIFSVSKSIVNFASDSSQTHILVNCNKTWNAYSDQPWLWVDYYQGDSILTLSAAENSGGARSAMVYLTTPDNSQYVITVYQKSSQNNNVFSVSDSVIFCDYTTQNKYLNVKCSQSWMALSNAGWLTVTKNQFDDSTLYISISENQGLSRQAVITLTADDSTKYFIDVIQEVNNSVAFFQISDSIIDFTLSKSQQYVTINSNRNWTYSTNASWLTLSKDNNSYLLISATENYSNARNTTISITTSDSTNYFIYVYQSTGLVPAEFTVSDSILYVSTVAQNLNVEVKCTKSWMAYTNVNWLTVNRSEYEDTTLYISVNENFGDTRVGTVTLLANDSTKSYVYVNQESYFLPTVFQLSDSIINFPLRPSQKVIQVNCNKSWTFSSNASWLNPSNGGSNTFIYLSASENFGEARTAVVTLTASDSTKTYIYVNQTSGNQAAEFIVSDSILNVNSGSHSLYLDVLCTKSWMAYTDVNWISLTHYAYEDSLLIVSISDNYGIARHATITLLANDSTKAYIYVNQEANNTPTYIQLSDSIVEFTHLPSQQYIFVSCDKEWDYSINASWLTITEDSTNTFLYISADENFGVSRNAVVTLITIDSTKAFIYINQSSGNEPAEFIVYDSIIDVTSVAQNLYEIVKCTKSWMAYTSENWLSVTHYNNIDTMLTISISENSGIARHATITLLANDSTKAYIYVNQKGTIVELTKNNSTAGSLSQKFSETERVTVTSLTVVGSIDVRDFLFIRDSLPLLQTLIIEFAQIEEYTGDLDSLLLKASTVYPANTIPQGAFKDKTTLTEVSLPNDLTAIEDLAFGGCVSLTKIIVNSEPETIEVSETAFEQVNKSVCEIVVPANTIGSISETSAWNQFTTISENETGNKELSNNEKIIVMPNPFVSTVFVKGAVEGSIVKLFSENGTLVASFNYSENMEIDLSDFKTGIYYLVTNNSSVTIIKK